MRGVFGEARESEQSDSRRGKIEQKSISKAYVRSGIDVGKKTVEEVRKTYEPEGPTRMEKRRSIRVLKEGDVFEKL